MAKIGIWTAWEKGEIIAGKREAEQGAGGEAEFKMAKKQSARQDGRGTVSLTTHTLGAWSMPTVTKSARHYTCAMMIKHRPEVRPAARCFSGMTSCFGWNHVPPKYTLKSQPQDLWLWLHLELGHSQMD